MKRLLAKIGRFFWSRGFLKFTLWTVTLIALFYAEEDWRGAHDWAQTKAQWEAKGKSLNFATFIPPEIPDDQNLGAIPLFKLERPSPKDEYREPMTLEHALDRFPDSSMPKLGNWIKSPGSLNFDQMQQAVNRQYLQLFAGQNEVTATRDPLLQLDAICPFLEDLRAAAAQRPLCRLPSDYNVGAPFNRGLGLLTSQLKLTRLLTLHAFLALHENQSGSALQDLKTVYKLASGTQRDPSLVGGLVALVMLAVSDGAIYDGLTAHAWSDAQLAEIEGEQSRFDFLALYQFDMKATAASSVANIEYFKHPNGLDVIKLIVGSQNGKPPSYTERLLPLWPSGWWDQNKASIAAVFFQLTSVFDPAERRVFPDRAEQMESRSEAAKKSASGPAPWRLISQLMTGPITAEEPLQFSRCQVWLDETRISCALERYHLAHGVYPPSLDELSPAFIATVPNDIMNGEPYHYRVQPDGTYLLYSVGWNQKDDGGLVVDTLPANASPLDSPKKHGDWVWPVLR